MKTFLMNLSIAIFLPVICSGAVIHVPGDQPTIQAGINEAVDGDTVLIADGTYTGYGNIGLSFWGTSLILCSANGPEKTIIECENLDRGMNFSAADNDVFIDGVTIRNGCGIELNLGGGIYSRGSPIIYNCRIQNCTGYFGAGIYCDNSSSTIDNCTIENNISEGSGGGISVFSSEITISNTLFKNNSARDSGGAIKCNMSDPVIMNCRFSGNYAYTGGAIYFDGFGFPVIGGQLNHGNRFEENEALIGMDLCCHSKRNHPVDARYNTFSGIHFSNYYVSPQESFDLSNCESDKVPITQDIYLSSFGSDTNDGISLQTPFKTLRYGMSLIHPTEEMPISIFIQPGIYSPSFTGETFPIPLNNHISLFGDNPVKTVFDAENSNPVFHISTNRNVIISGLTMKNGVSGYFSAEGGIYALDSELQLLNCIIDQNTGLYGGGLLCRNGTVGVINCLFTRNHSYDKWDSAGAAIDAFGTALSIANSTFYWNSADNGAGIKISSDDTFTIKNCISWDNYPEEFFIWPENCVSYSVIKGGYPGTSNINLDPIFISGPYGDFYLSQIDAGQTVQSPCIDGGSEPSSEICFETGNGPLCLSDLTTRIDSQTDPSTVDIGFHYPVPVQPDQGVQLFLSKHYFNHGDHYNFQADLIYNGTETLHDQVLFIILNVFGSFFWYPSWSNILDYQQFDLDPGVETMTVIAFDFPEVYEFVTDIYFYAAILNQDMDSVVGQWDWVCFGWGP